MKFWKKSGQFLKNTWRNFLIMLINFIGKIEELKETFEEKQARKQAAIQAMLDWAKAAHCRSTEDWTREELYNEDLNNGQVVEGVKIVNPFV